MFLWTIGTDKISNRFPVVGGFFRHSGIVDRLASTAVNRTFTIRAATGGAGSNGGGNEGGRLEKVQRRGRKELKEEEEEENGGKRRRIVRKETFPWRCLYAVRDSGSYTVTTPSCFRYTCLAIFVPHRAATPRCSAATSPPPLFNQFSRLRLTPSE